MSEDTGDWTVTGRGGGGRAGFGGSAGLRVAMGWMPEVPGKKSCWRPYAYIHLYIQNTVHTF